jgi:hypothetical protein
MKRESTNRTDDPEPPAPEPVGDPDLAPVRREAKPSEVDEHTPEEAGYGYGV